MIIYSNKEGNSFKVTIIKNGFIDSLEACKIENTKRKSIKANHKEILLGSLDLLPLTNKILELI